MSKHNSSDYSPLFNPLIMPFSDLMLSESHNVCSGEIQKNVKLSMSIHLWTAPFLLYAPTITIPFFFLLTAVTYCLSRISSWHHALQESICHTFHLTSDSVANLQLPLYLLFDCIHTKRWRTLQIYTLNSGICVPAVSLNHQARCSANCHRKCGIWTSHRGEIYSAFVSIHVCVHTWCSECDRLFFPLPLQTLESQGCLFSQWNSGVGDVNTKRFPY